MGRQSHRPYDIARCEQKFYIGVITGDDFGLVSTEDNMHSRPLIGSATTTARSQFCGPNGRDTYATTYLEVEGNAIVVTICGPGDCVCQSRRITNPDVMAFIRWRLDTVGELNRHGGA